jgi:hypothetical protein
MKKKMQLCIIVPIISFFLFSCTKSENQAFKGVINYKSEVSNIKEWCSSLFFISDAIGFATSENGKIYKTEDSGVNWSLLNTVSSLPLSGSFFLNKNIGYAFGGKANCSPNPCTVPGSILYKSINGGNTWAKQNIPYKWSELNSAYFFNENSGYIVGLGLCLKTNNGGTSWQSVSIGNNNIKEISFKSQNVGYCISLMGDLLKTEDGGQTWTEINVGTEKGTLNISFLNEDVGYVNYYGHLYRTNDGGKSWDSIQTTDDTIIYTHFINENTGLIVQRKYTSTGITSHFVYIIQLTIDGGNTWINKELNEQDFNSNCLFAIGNTVYSLAYDKIFSLTIE